MANRSIRERNGAERSVKINAYFSEYMSTPRSGGTPIIDRWFCDIPGVVDERYHRTGEWQPDTVAKLRREQKKKLKEPERNRQNYETHD